MRVQLPLALLLTACVANPPSDEDVLSALEQENGGFETTDEAPMFASEDTFGAAEIEADLQVADPMQTDPTIATIETAPNADVLDVMMLWGQLPPNPEATTVRDWSGELQLSRGGMYVRRRIGFEEAMADRVLPRTTPDAIAFESRTLPFADGLALRIVEDPARAAEPLFLTYTPNAGDVRELDVTALREGPLSIDAGDNNRVVAIATRRNDACQHGFIRGRWHKISPNASTYLGLVANPHGEVVGHIRGIAGQRRNGDAVMFGKFISREGGFVGLVKGTYENGELHARWLDRDGDHGQINGLYFEGGPNPRSGGFLARWAETSCEAR